MTPVLTKTALDRVRIASYNLRKHRAAHELESLAIHHDLDVLCVQEAVSASLPEQLEHMRLVHTTAGNRLGLGLYVRDDRFDVAEARTFQLKSSLHDLLFSPAHERLLGARLIDRETERSFVAASFHAAPLTALNSLRRHQINAAHESLHVLGGGVPSIMVGDFNYPVFQSRLSRHLQGLGVALSVSDKRTYLRYRVIRGHFDFATSRGATIDRVRTLDQGTSDHLPILVEAGY